MPAVEALVLEDSNEGTSASEGAEDER